MPLTNRVETEEVLDLCPSGEIFACDFYLTGAETWAEKAWGFQRGLVTNVDHHAPVARMRQHLSSTNLALLRVRQEGVVAAGSHIVLNHTDCDSVLSAAVLSGAVEPSDELGVAAIAADHTGEPNAIADLLQTVDALLVPSPLDLWASVGIREVIGQVSHINESLQSLLIVNQCQPHTKLAKEVLDILSDFGIPLCPVVLRQRTAYRQAAIFGQTVHDLDAQAKPAIHEIEELTDYLCRVLDLSLRKDS